MTTIHEIADAMRDELTEKLATLSPRELQVYERIAVGKYPADISSELGLSVKTVSTYRARVLDKLGVRSNAEVARLHAQQALAVAASHTTIAAAMCAGVAVWHPLESGAGEVAVRGLRYFTRLDVHGVPALHEPLRSALHRALSAAQAVSTSAQSPATEAASP